MPAQRVGKSPPACNRKGRGNIRSFDGWRAKRWPPRPCATAAGAGSGAGRGGLARCLLARGGALGGLLGLGGLGGLLPRGLLLRGSVLAVEIGRDAWRGRVCVYV